MYTDSSAPVAEVCAPQVPLVFLRFLYLFTFYLSDHLKYILLMWWEVLTLIIVLIYKVLQAVVKISILLILLFAAVLLTCGKVL